jgi:hypothetical protein
VGEHRRVVVALVLRRSGRRGVVRGLDDRFVRISDVDRSDLARCTRVLGVLFGIVKCAVLSCSFVKCSVLSCYSACRSAKYGCGATFCCNEDVERTASRVI